ncbi:hypothetical protein [Spirulina sp. 06S082]|uniref:hypothetical protein n=1 Tax=Spirulina sp. 06S082 TaxID=3110248 RepID=UPI002B22060C|nr:hypothetical protein [Spirulina sp. 06S082]MEA5469327.1 hypothetical protein [Spirulina sp. 06S082]
MSDAFKPKNNGQNFSDPRDLANGDRAPGEYPDREGFAPGAENKGLGYIPYKVTYRSESYSENNEGGWVGGENSVNVWGPIGGFIKTDKFYGFTHHGPVNLPWMKTGGRTGIGSSAPTTWENTRITIIDINPMNSGEEEKDPRRPYIPSPRRPNKPHPSKLPESPTKKPNKEPGIGVGDPIPVIPLKPDPIPSIPSPSNSLPDPKKPKRTPYPNPQTNPTKNPQKRPIAPIIPYPFPTPGPAYTPPDTPLGTPTGSPTGSPLNLPSPSESPSESSGGNGIGNIPLIPTFIKNPVKPTPSTPSQKLRNDEPCRCSGLQSDEDYMIAKALKIQVPIVVEIAGVPVNRTKTITIVSIKGVSNASDVLQAYQLRADMRRTQILARNQIAGQVGINNKILLWMEGFLKTQFPIAIKLAQNSWNAAQVLVNNPLIDRAIAILNLSLALHNAAQLSNEILVTVTGTIDLILSFFGIEWKTVDSDGVVKPVSTQGVISEFFANTLKRTLGAETFTKLSIQWLKANRIYQAASNVIDSTQNTLDSILNLNELTANVTGKVGNALKRAGVVMEDAYEWFDEKVDSVRENSKFGWINKLENTQEAVEVIEEIVSTTVEIKESLQEMKEATEEFNEAIEEANKDNLEQWEQVKLQSEIQIDLGTLELSSIEDDIEKDIEGN